MIEIRNFSKSYNRNLILEISNLSISKGIHTLSGKNGSGKTTLLKCISGILPYEGHVSIGGIENSKRNMKEYRKLVRYSPAEPIFPNFLKNIDLINFYSSLLPTESNEIDYLTRAFGVNEFEEVEIGHYSSGMIKKLSLTLSFIGNSKLIILDEPYNALDAEACQILDQMIVNKRESGTSFLITSHQSGLHQSVNTKFRIEDCQLTIDL